MWSQYFSQNIRIPHPRHPTQSFNVYYSPPSSEHAPVFVFHHGAGSNALSFAVCAKVLSQSIQAGIVAFDVRYHGLTDVEEGEEWMLGLDTLAEDEVAVVGGIAERSGWIDGSWPDLIFVGHRYRSLFLQLHIFPRPGVTSVSLSLEHRSCRSFTSFVP
jgi:protein phosphatase methylesterase 1